MRSSGTIIAAPASSRSCIRWCSARIFIASTRGRRGAFIELSAKLAIWQSNGLYDTDALRLSLPWLIHHIEATWRVMGKDFWAYGLEPNRPALEAIGRYVYEQGLSPRIVSPDELFAADVERGVDERHPRTPECLPQRR